MFFNFAKRLWQPKSLRRSTHKPRATRLSLEHLEDRLVPSSTGFEPWQIQQAYGFNQISFSNGAKGDGSGQTIAIIDPGVDPNISQDVDAFDQLFGLNSSNSPSLYNQTQYGPASNFLSVVQYNPSGGIMPQATTNQGTEESMDVEWAHAIAPGAKIVLVEADSPNDLWSAAQYAASNLGASVVSMSFGASGAVETGFDSDFTQPGVTFVASAGDDGLFLYPAASANVLAVGGTSLTVNASGNYVSEKVWNDSSDGGSEPVYVTSGGVDTLQNQNTDYRESGGGSNPYDPGKLSPDVAYNADKDTGFYVYDSWDPDNSLVNNNVYVPNPPNPNLPDLIEDGGTSAGAPQWAALVAIADQGREILDGQGSSLSTSQTLAMIHNANMGTSDFHQNIAGSIEYSLNGTQYSYSGSQVVGQVTPIANNLVPDLAYGAAPSAPSLTANPVSSSQINLSWNSVADAHDYTVERSLVDDPNTNDSNWQVIANNTSLTSWADTGLQAGTTYYYCIKASNGLGSSAYSALVSAATLPAAPGTPTGVKATPVSTSEIDVSWNSDPGAINYEVKWSGNDGSHGALITSSLYCNVTGLNPGISYSFQVSASNAGGSSAYSGSVSATTDLGAPTGLTAKAGGDDFIVLNWSSDAGATSYTVEWSGTDGSSGTDFTSNPYCSVAVLQPATTYTFQVLADNATESSPASLPVSATTLTAAPTNLTANAVSSSQINLSWNPVSGASGYDIYRSNTNSSSGFVKINSTPVSGTTFSDVGLNGYTSYWYEVSAVDAGGESSVSSVAYAVTYPAVPTGLSATSASNYQINLSWSADPGASSYRLERSLVDDPNVGDSNWQVIAPSINGTSYTDTGLQAGTTYYYCIQASDGAGSSPYSLPLGVTTSAVVPETPTLNGAQPGINVIYLYGASGGDPNAQHYVVKRSLVDDSNPNDSNWQQITILTSSGGYFSYNDAGLQAGTTYYYSVQATNAIGNTIGKSAWSNIVSATTWPATPTGLIATPGATAAIVNGQLNAYVNLTWTGVKGAECYGVFRSQVNDPNTSDTNWNFVGYASGTSYTDTVSNSDTTYYYSIYAVNNNGAGGSGMSAPVAGVSSMTADEKFVNQLYKDILGRSASKSDLDGWVSNIPYMGLQGVANQFLHGQEYYSDLVTNMYQQFLGRSPDSAGLSYYVGQLQNNLQTELQVMSDLLGGTEFYGKAGSTPAGFVTALYKDVLGSSSPDASGLSYWVGQLNSGAMNTTQVALAFVSCTTARQDAVEAMYGWTGQSPSTPLSAFQQIFPDDLLGRLADTDGLDYYVLYGGSGEDLLSVAAALAGSTEFYNDAKNS